MITKLSAIIIYVLFLFGIGVSMLFIWPAALVIKLYEKAELENPLLLISSICVSLIVYWGSVLYLSGCR